MPGLDELLLRVVRVGYPGLTVGAFVFFTIWESGRPRVPFAQRRTHVLRNLGLFALLLLFADGLVGSVLMGIPARLLDAPRGLLSPLGLPLPVLVVVGLLAVDLACYAWHRTSHRLRPLWLLHAVHHTDPHLDVSTALRFHPVDMAFYVAIIAGTLTALGIPLWVAGLRAVALNPQLMAQHANVSFPPAVERAFGWLFVTPAIHRVHHSAQAPGIDANFGQMFSLWDRMFGSYIAPADADPPRIGVDGFAGDEWQTVGGMVMTPWRGRAAL